MSPTSRPASPRSRGWTRDIRGEGGGHGGFPALAGMDRARPICASVSLRLPRARGDGPWSSAAPRAFCRASPRSRGWTRISRATTGRLRGFPALAGMDPETSETIALGSRLPRARGDGPSCSGWQAAARPASPRSRGWTAGARSRSGAGDGFPALAGMDPTAWLTSTPRYRLPRARGDGPKNRVREYQKSRASPRSRGWTRRAAPSASGVRGFPALAGMDPLVVLIVLVRRGLPRARGDGPVALGGAVRAAWASPRSRGWTVAGVRRGVFAAGFPALAGMDPGLSSSIVEILGLPRARGDGPSGCWGTASASAASPRSRGWTPVIRGESEGAEGFPALAGMDPGPRTPAARTPRLPRARGDGPCPVRRSSPAAGASPRSRGWTRQHGAGGRRRAGFPALAGMDPDERRVDIGRGRLPRARGDGPDQLRFRPCLEPASPRSRGWTPYALTTAAFL